MLPTPDVAPVAAVRTRLRVRWLRVVTVAVGAVALAIGVYSTALGNPLASPHQANDAAALPTLRAPARPARTPRLLVHHVVPKATVSATLGSAPAAGNASAPRDIAAHGPGAQLPYTGFPAWVIALLGLLLVVAGGFVQLRASQIDDVARQYRRGLLLRPLYCLRIGVGAWREAVSA